MNMQNRNNYTPDVLDCLANLSNDEVFTPPSVVNQMLDMLPQEVFMSKDTTFLDPFTKSGVFLREITKRLLENQIPDYKKTSDEIEIITKEATQNAVRSGSLDLDDKDYEDKARRIGDAALKSHPDANKYLNFEIDLQDALDHILKNQVFGIAITELTAQLARRSLYCSKDASSRYSVANVAFGANADGNIRFYPMKHTWDKVNQNGTAQSGASCKYCGASASNLDRPDDLESHAYEFIHKDIADIRKELNDMEFTVVCGNPPYQLNDGGGTGDSAKPIYHYFIEQAKRLNPKYLTMIIPSRWMKGGKGLDKFRKDMMSDTAISYLVDYESSEECFGNNVKIDGGVCYFLRDSTYNGVCHFIHHCVDGFTDVSDRNLKSDLVDTIIRDSRQISIIEKAKSDITFDSIVSSRKPYGVATDLFNTPEHYPNSGLSLEEDKSKYKIFGVKGNKGGAKRLVGYVDKSFPTQNLDEIDKYKIFFSYAYTTTATVPPQPILAEPDEIATETFLRIGAFNTKGEAESCLSYIKTKFFRALLFFNRAQKNASTRTFNLIPLVSFDRLWTDAELYDKYGLTQDEIDFIESMIKPME